MIFHPTDVQSLVLYDLNPFQNRDYITSYTNTSRYALTPVKTQMLFAQTEREPLTIWKGAFLGVVATRHGRTFHLAVSNYGRFARVLETGEPSGL